MQIENLFLFWDKMLLIWDEIFSNSDEMFINLELSGKSIKAIYEFEIFSILTKCLIIRYFLSLDMSDLMRIFIKSTFLDIN